MKRALRRGAWAPALLVAALVSPGCIFSGYQRWPGPMRATADPLPEGDTALHRPGPEEVVVLRHADPVRIRPAGALSGRPMEFFDKRRQLTAGGAVIVAPGGRAEIMWPSGASIVLLGDSVAWVGSPSRGEPILQFDDLERARLFLSEGDSVRLLGGALLSGVGGPFVLERSFDQVLSVHNQSSGGLSVAFRDELFELAPTQIVRLPLLASGGAPFVDDPSLQRFEGEGFNVRIAGDLHCEDLEGAVRVSATGGVDGHARALGVRVKLASGDSARFRALPVRTPATIDSPRAPASDQP